MVNRTLTRTKTGRYILRLYGRATLAESIEVAASRMREECLVDDRRDKIPVDIDHIVARRGIVAQASESQVADALLFPSDVGFALKMAGARAPARTRFTLAHEVGHTLFRHGRRHVVGLLDAREIQAEEIICDMFAGALLMPLSQLSRFAGQVCGDKPWEILQVLEKIARRFDVSLPACVCRLGRIGGDCPCSAIVLCLSYFRNKHTKAPARLRVESCSSLGALGNARTWHNKAASVVQLWSAEDLFSVWAGRVAESGEASGGRYTLTPDGEVVRATRESLHWIPEDLRISLYSDDKWHNDEVFPAMTASALYAGKGWGPEKAYIVCLATRRERSGEEMRYPSGTPTA